MKKNCLKLILIAVISVLTFSMSACTYRQDGSVIQDAKFEICYENTAGEEVEITSTLKLYKTFAPDTTDRIISLVKNKFYNNTQIVFDNSGSYLILGSYRMDNGEYKNIIADDETYPSIRGEFDENGFVNAGKLSTQTAGTLVMLREPGDGKGTASKYDSAKVTFAIILSATSTLPSNSYTAFGKIDEDSLEAFKTMKDDLYENANGYTHARYVGDRDETTDLLIVNNGSYVNSFEYYERDGKAYRKVNGEYVEFDYETENDADYDVWNKISSAYSFDNIVLPQKDIIIKKASLK